MDDAVNQNVSPDVHEGEFITVHAVELDFFLETLNEFKRKGYSVSSKLFLFAFGLAFKEKTKA